MNQLREEILISKAIGGDATPQEWDELDALAQQSPDLWRQLAGCLRDERAFDRVVNDAGALADAVEIPFAEYSAARLRHPAAWKGWAGWAVAALVALSFIAANVQQSRLGAGHGNPSQTASLANVPAADLLQAYLDNGRQEQRVIGELPERVLVEQRPAPAGSGFELLYVRQIFEREVVPELYRPAARDDGGRVMMVRCPAPPRPPM